MKAQTCTYCGQNGETTNDHVIPVCLFTKPLPGLMITVPACEACHGSAKSEDDSYLRDMLVLHHGSESHPVAKELAYGKALRASKYNNSKVANALREKGKLVPVYKKGLLIGEGGVVPLEAKRVNRIFATMLRGLHFSSTGQVLASDAVFENFSATPDWCANQRKRLHQASIEPLNLGHSDMFVFTGYRFPLNGDPYESAWLVTFYSGIHYFLYSHRPGHPGFQKGEQQPSSIDQIDHWEL